MEKRLQCGERPPEDRDPLLSEGGLERLEAVYGHREAQTVMSCAPDGIPHGRIVFPGGAKLTVLMASYMGNIELLS